MLMVVVVVEDVVVVVVEDVVGVEVNEDGINKSY